MIPLLRTSRCLSSSHPAHPRRPKNAAKGGANATCSDVFSRSCGAYVVAGSAAPSRTGAVRDFGHITESSVVVLEGMLFFYTKLCVFWCYSLARQGDQRQGEDYADTSERASAGGRRTLIATLPCFRAGFVPDSCRTSRVEIIKCLIQQSGEAWYCVTAVGRLHDYTSSCIVRETASAIHYSSALKRQ